MKIKHLFEIRNVLLTLKNRDVFGDSPELFWWASENLSDLTKDYGPTEANELSSAMEAEQKLIKEYQKKDSEERSIFRYQDKIFSMDEDGNIFDSDGNVVTPPDVNPKEMLPVFENREEYIEERESIMNEEKDVNLTSISKEKFFEKANSDGIPAKTDLSVLNPILE